MPFNGISCGGSGRPRQIAFNIKYGRWLSDSRHLTMCLATLDCAISNPRLSSSAYTTNVPFRIERRSGGRTVPRAYGQAPKASGPGSGQDRARFDDSYDLNQGPPDREGGTRPPELSDFGGANTHVGCKPDSAFCSSTLLEDLSGRGGVRRRLCSQAAARSPPAYPRPGSGRSRRAHARPDRAPAHAAAGYRGVLVA